MKFRLAAAIALYFLLSLLFSTLSTTSSRIFQTSLLPQSKNNILYRIVNECLTCKDIIVLRQTCYDFQYLLHPNDANMVTFCIYGVSKTMTNTNIIWEDLKYFMKQNYYSAFYEMKMFNIKENEYVVLTHVPEEKYIVWNNKSIPYHQMLLNETTPYTAVQNYYEKHLEPMQIANRYKTAWAIITKERNVKTDGNKDEGGDSGIVQSKLKNVKMIFSTDFAFAALLDNGTVVAWGKKTFGGEIPDKIKTQLVNVKKLFSTRDAFAALLDNGTVVAWGYENHGGEIPDKIKTQLVNVKMIFSTDSAFAALLDNGTVVAWGKENDGGKIRDEIQTQLVHVKKIYSTCYAFAALLDNGTVVAWGDEDHDGKIPDVIQNQLVDVKMIFSTDSAFAALLDNGTFFAWGRKNYGGKIPRDIRNYMIKNVKMIFSTSYAFAVLLDNGAVVAWGNKKGGGNIPDDIQTQLIGVKRIFPKRKQFTALFEDGAILTWGTTKKVNF